MNKKLTYTREEQKILACLQRVLPRPRFLHSLSVMRAAEKIAERYGENTHHARLAGLMHDASRGFSIQKIISLACRYDSKIFADPILRKNPRLLHGFASAALARIQFGVTDSKILHAMAFHTIACKNMSIFDKIIYLADCTASDRRFKLCKRLRKLGMQDIDAAMRLALQIRISHVMDMHWMLHPNSVYALNELLR
ncbi:MAG: bis(5'-nucleosyl)-tetraphosphatase (symmetrical) YqeK [bacterium]